MSDESPGKREVPFWLRPISRRNLLRLGGATALGGGAGAGYMFRWEPENIEISRRQIVLGPLAKDKLVHAVQLSDLHLSKSVSGAYLRRAVAQAVELKPDLFFVTGDFVTGTRWEAAELTEILRPLAQTAPTYGVLGNHDGGAWGAQTYGPDSADGVKAVLREAGIDLILNEVRRITVRGLPLILVGLGDYWNEEFLPLPAFHQLAKSEWTEHAGPATRPPIVLLSHNPDSKEALKGYPWDLMLCGHTHGGQLVVPFLGLRPFLPVEDKRFSEGLYAWEGRQIYITRGVGNLHGARINCRPEISRLDLVVG